MIEDIGDKSTIRWSGFDGFAMIKVSRERGGAYTTGNRTSWQAVKVCNRGADQGTLRLRQSVELNRLRCMNNKIVRFQILTHYLAMVLLALALPGLALANGMGFGKVFSPSTIGPGSASKLTFTITGSNTPASDLAFTDVLPAGITLATPASAVTDCVDARVTAADGGTTITMADGRLPASPATCTVSVNVVGTATATNTSGTLTSSLGTSGTATATLTVSNSRPGFAKSFAPATIPLGGTSKLTLTITNKDESAMSSMGFADFLPTGMIIATPANAANTCNGALTAVSGASTISLAGASLAAGAGSTTCTISVDVTTTITGVFVNTTGILERNTNSTPLAGGFATAALNVPVNFLVKSFTDDPVAPGGTVTLKFSIQNPDRINTATAIAFTDPLPAGLSATGLPATVCGGTLSGTTTLSFAGGSLAGGASCNFNVTLTVPGGATLGSHTNTTTAITATIDGTGVTGNTATDVLVVTTAPKLTKLFVGDPVGTGDTVTLRFTIENTSMTSAATAIAFDDELTKSTLGGGGSTLGFLPFPVTVALPANPVCGGTLSKVSMGTDREGLRLTGGTLTAAPGAGSTCTFDVTLTIPAGLAAGTHINTTEEITATVDGSTRSGSPASDDLVVVAPPTLAKEFTNDPVDPSSSVTLKFTLTHASTAAGNATAVGFTDDLTTLVPTIAGLAATGLPLNDVCGTGNGTLSGTTSLTFSGATLTPGQVCTFSVTLNVPAGATPGSHTNTTSAVSATVSGVTATGNKASDDLQIATLTLTKEFTDDPVIAGGIANLRFTLNNQTAVTATSISFTDNLGGSAAIPPNIVGALPGLKATGLPLSVCSGTLTGSVLDTNLIFAGGSVAAGTSCFFDVSLLVPVAAPDGTHVNTTDSVTSSLGTGASASDGLIVNSTLLQLTKAFTNNPVAPGGTANLRFTLTNLATGAASAIAFDDDLTTSLAPALAGLTATGVPKAVCGGTLAPNLSFSGGSLAATGSAGDSCTFDVSVTVPGAAAKGTYTNTTTAVSGTVGGLAVKGTPASGDLRVDVVKFTKSFAADAVAGTTVKLSFTIDNSASTTPLTTLGFTDDLATVVGGLIPIGLPKNDVCGTGSVFSVAGSVILLTGGNLLAGATCTFDVTLQVPGIGSQGTYSNTTSALKEVGVPVTGPATASLTVLPAKTFTGTTGSGSGSATLTFTGGGTSCGYTVFDYIPLEGHAKSPPASSAPAGFTFPHGLASFVIAGCTPGFTAAFTFTLPTPPDATTEYWKYGPTAANATPHWYKIPATVTGSTVTFSVTDGGLGDDDLTANGTIVDQGGPGVPPPPPAFAKVFASDTIVPGATSTLTFTIDNTGSTVTATALDFTDSLPAGVVVAGTPNASTTCTGGTLTAVAAGGTITYTGGSVAASAACTVGVDVTSNTIGAHLNVSGSLTSSLGTSSTATDTLTVNSAPPFSKLFAPNAIVEGATSTLTFTIDNTGSTVAATPLAFTDTMPGAVTVVAPPVVSNTCGGTLTATGGTNVITLAGGTVAASASCKIDVAVTSTLPGTHVNTSGDLTSPLGNSGKAISSLLVTGVAAPIPSMTDWSMVLLTSVLLLLGCLRLFQSRQWGRRHPR